VSREPVIVLGLTFKEDCPDIRNSRVVDVIRELQSFGATVFVHDPMVDPVEAEREYGLRLTGWDDLPKAAAIVAAVSHKVFSRRGVEDFVGKLVPRGVYVDVKSRADADALRARGIEVWRL
jgi:UDP-N-acetyl-D-galactosamine dehydrogenase